MGAWGMLPIEYPIFIADQRTAAGQDGDLIVHSTICSGLQDALDRAKEKTGCDKIMVFDGSFGYMNVSRSMAELLLANAPAAAEEARQLMPKWLKQRGIDPSEL